MKSYAVFLRLEGRRALLVGGGRVAALRSGETQVSDIVEQAGIHQSGVSRHVRILHDAGFVSMRPDAQRRLYSLRPAPSFASRYRLAAGRCLSRAAAQSNSARRMRPDRIVSNEIRDFP